MTRFCIALGVLVGFGTTAAGGVFAIPLPELEGIYSTGGVAPSHRDMTFHFDPNGLGGNEMYLKIKGTSSLGRALRPGAEAESDFFPYVAFSYGPADQYREYQGIPGRSGAHGHGLMLTGAFDETIPLVVVVSHDQFGMPLIGPPLSWYLPNGEGSAYVQVLRSGSVFDFGGLDWQESIPAVFTITEAALVIEGSAVPEPGVAVLVPALLLLKRRPRRSKR